MKVLVTGSAGLIGRWTVAGLVEAGHEVIGLDKIEPPIEFSGRCSYTCDILDTPRLKAVFQECHPEAVIHLAARIDLDEEQDLRGYAANTDGVRNVVDAVRHTPSVRRVVYTSSQLVCKVGYIPKSMDEYCPNTLYGQSKVLTEQIVKEADGGVAEWCLVRPTTVWGPGMSPHYQRMLDLITRGLFFHCGEGKLYKSYSYAANIAYQYVRLLAAPARAIHRRTLYLADYEPLSLRDYTNLLAKELGAKPIRTMPLPMAKLLAYVGDIAGGLCRRSLPLNSFRLRNILTEYVFDLRETRAVCGPLPSTFEEGVRKTASWYRDIVNCRMAARTSKQTSVLR